MHKMQSFEVQQSNHIKGKVSSFFYLLILSFFFKDLSFNKQRKSKKKKWPSKVIFKIYHKDK